MNQQGVYEQDPFDAMIIDAEVIDLGEAVEFLHAAEVAARYLANRTGRRAELLAEAFLDGARKGATPVIRGIALPHLRLPEVEYPLMVIVRSRQGIRVDGKGLSEGQVSHAVFFIVSPERDPEQHLRLLAALASRVSDDRFMTKWCAAADEQRLKEMLLQPDRHVSLELADEGGTGVLLNRRIDELGLPEGTGVVMVHRAGELLTPAGDLLLREGDRLTVVGPETAIRELQKRYRS